MGRFGGFAFSGKNPALLNSRPTGINHQLKIDFAQLLVVKRHVILTALQLERVGVQIVSMRRIDGVLHGLQPVAAQHLANIDFFESVLADEQVPFGKERFLVRGPHICEQKTGELFHGVGRMPDFVLEPACRILKRLFETLAAGIVFPAVIRATDTVIFDKAVIKGCAAMRAMFAD